MALNIKRMIIYLLLNILIGTLGNVVQHEKRHTSIEVEGHRMSRDAIIPMRFAIQQSNLHLGYNHLVDVSHPDSPGYGKYWTSKDVYDFFAPADESVKIVKDWLLSTGIDNEDIIQYENKGWLAIDLPVEKAEKLLSTTYSEYDFGGETRIGCAHYSLPPHVSPHVDFVKPGVVLSAPMTKRNLEKREHTPLKNRHEASVSHLGVGGPARHRPHYHLPPAAHGLPPELEACGVNITPPCIRALYGLPDPTSPRPIQPENALGLFERLDSFSQADIDLFFKNYASYIPQGTSPEVLSMDGGKAPVRPNGKFNLGESVLDLDLAYSLVYPQKIIVYQVDDRYQRNSKGDAKNGLFNTFLDSVDGSYCNYKAYGITGDSPEIDNTYPSPREKGYKGERMCGTYELTRVLSISYALPEEQYPVNYLRRQCDEFMKLSLQGHTILVASGDYGVAGTPLFNEKRFSLDCSSPSHRDRVHKPMSPSTCPFVTSVGGTRLYPDQTINDPESALEVNATSVLEGYVYPGFHTALEYFASGGGFSNYFERPSYQEPAVSQYLNKYVQSPSYVANEQATNIGVNGVFNRAGRGFPDVSANGANLLYYLGKELDVTYGTSLSTPIFASIITLINEKRTAAGKGPVGFLNPVFYSHPEIFNDIKNGSNYNCASPGFKATEGWDAITGLGTPIYPKMLELFMSLP